MVDDEEIFLGRYSSDSFSDFFSDYKNFIAKLDDAPLAVRKQFMLDGKNYDFNKLAILFNSYKDKANNILFRKSHKANDITVDFWLCKVQNKVRFFEGFSVPSFNGLNESDAIEILSTSLEDKAYLSVPSLLIKYGIIVIFEQTLPGLNLDGAVYSNEQGNPVISLSIRHNRIDNFWFTLAHELAHVILHYDSLREVILDDLDETMNLTHGKEFEANKLAGDMLISRRVWRSCPVKFSNDSLEIIQFSEEVGINPAIVAGRLRKERNNYSLFTDLIYKEDLRRALFNG